jgi:hypothetical protein
VHLSSPAGTRQPSAAGGTADDRDLSFRLGRVTLDPAPRFPAWGPVGHRRWAPACALDRLDGFYGWEKGFGWMAGTLEATVETTGHAWINLRVGGRFAGLKGTAGLALSVDGVRRGTLLLRGESTAFSVEAAPAGRHVVQLRSEDGAVSPLAAGLGADARELSYRLLEIDVSAAPRFGPAPLRQPDPAGAPLCRH